MFYIMIPIVIFLGDECIKKWANQELKEKREIPILKEKVRLNLLHNDGAFLSFLSEFPIILKTISGVFLLILGGMLALGIRKNENVFWKTGLSILLGGALSNVFDRFTKGYVTDYFSFSFLKKIVFNLSDLCIMVGSILMLIGSFLKKK